MRAVRFLALTVHHAGKKKRAANMSRTNCVALPCPSNFLRADMHRFKLSYSLSRPPHVGHGPNGISYRSGSALPREAAICKPGIFLPLDAVNMRDEGEREI